MATRTLVGSSADWEAVANWSGAAAPVNGDSIHVLNGSQTFTTNMDQGDIDPATIRFGENWEGQITTTNKLVLGATTSVYIDCPRCPALALSAEDAHTITDAYVYRTGPGAYACYLTGESAQTGVWTDLFLVGGNIRLGSTVKTTNVYIYPAATVTMDSGGSITTVNNYGGTVHCQAAVTTINNDAGVWYHEGRTTGNVTTINNRGTFYLDCEGMTIGVIHAYAGLVDGTRHSYANTVNSGSSGTIQYGARVWLNQQTTISNNFNDHSMGQGYRGPSGTTVTIPAVPI